MMNIVEVVAALIWNGEKFMICQRPANKREDYCGNLSVVKLKKVNQKNKP